MLPNVWLATCMVVRLTNCDLLNLFMQVALREVLTDEQLVWGLCQLVKVRARWLARFAAQLHPCAFKCKC